MDSSSFVNGALIDVAVRFLLPSSPFSIVSYLTAFTVFGFVIVARSKRKSGFWRKMFPTRIFRSRSTRLDVTLYILNFVFLGFVFSFITIGAGFWSGLTRGTLHLLFGSNPIMDIPVWAALLTTTLLELLLLELGYWFAHYVSHRVPAIWEFHKVHHSAEVMSPLTEGRQHPLDVLFFQNVVACSLGLGYGVMQFLFGTTKTFAIWQTNVFLLVFFLTVSHLRHSHVWLPFTGLAGKLIHSPAHHQIHHSTAVRDHNKNLGFSLSLWDWIFGTLRLPEKREQLRFGLDAGEGRFLTMRDSLAAPFARAAGHLR